MGGQRGAELDTSPGPRALQGPPDWAAGVGSGAQPPRNLPRHRGSERPADPDPDWAPGLRCLGPCLGTGAPLSGTLIGPRGSSAAAGVGQNPPERGPHRTAGLTEPSAPGPLTAFLHSLPGPPPGLLKDPHTGLLIRHRDWSEPPQTVPLAERWGLAQLSPVPGTGTHRPCSSPGTGERHGSPQAQSLTRQWGSQSPANRNP